MNPIVVTFSRAGAAESTHEVHAVLADSTGAGRSRGDGTLSAFWRSSMKPFQAIPFVRDGVLDELGLGPAELALACASHHGTPRHVEVVERMLRAAGLEASKLACGPHRPLDAEAARALDREGTLPGRIHNNCSGKHAAMLAVCAARGWPLEGYESREHPLQAEIRHAVAPWIDEDPDALTWGTDGCGVPTPRLELGRMATAYARFGASVDSVSARIAGAMTGNPMLISGPRAFSAAIMRVTGGRLLAKEGAEGVFCLCEPGADLGVALKVRDGASRAIGPATMAVLSAEELILDEERRELADFETITVRNTQDRIVGEIRAEAG